MPITFGDIETIDRDELRGDYDRERTVYVTRDLFADAVSAPDAGTHKIGIGDAKDMARAVHHDDSGVAGIVSFPDAKAAQAAVGRIITGRMHPAQPGELPRAMPAERNFSLIVETFRTLASLPGASVHYDAGIGHAAPESLERGDIVSVNRTVARGAAAPEHGGMTEEAILASRWTVSSVKDGRATLINEAQNRSISATARDVVPVDAAYESRVRAEFGEDLAYRRLMQLRLNAHAMKGAPEHPGGGAVMLHPKAARHIAATSKISEYQLKAAIWSAGAARDGIVPVATIKGGAIVAGEVKADQVMPLYREDLEPAREISARLESRDMAATFALLGQMAAGKAPAERRTETIQITRKEVIDAIGALKDDRDALTPMGRVAAGLAMAIAQPEWKQTVGGGLRETGNVTSGLAALEALNAGFGKGATRRLTFDATVAKATMDDLGRPFKIAYGRARDESAEREYEAEQRRDARRIGLARGAVTNGR